MDRTKQEQKEREMSLGELIAHRQKVDKPQALGLKCPSLAWNKKQILSSRQGRV